MSIRHVVKPGTEGIAWCDYAFQPFDFRILDAQHAAACIEQQTLVQPCKRCVAAIKRAGLWPSLTAP